MKKLKKLSSLLLATVMAISALFIPGTSFAGDYEASLAKAGFTSSYIAALSKLHSKYPNWNFMPLETNLSLDEAVSSERRKHSQQLIQKTESNEAKGYLCRCSDCYVNGSYVIREGKTWVSASEAAVKYYMNPLNFLDEKYIFQFESTSYESGQTTAGIETIIQNTWMYNSYISYKDSSGNTQKYTSRAYPNGVKYSQAILDAAKYSGLSAYYLASKIVQEVGGKSPTAAGASGTNSKYPGIYNYYNIGANTGAEDGLKWASSGASGFATNTDNVRLRSQPNTSSTILAKLPKNTSATLISTTEKQNDGYVWCYVKVNYNGKALTGYIRSDLLGEQYGRPWTNPYRSIYNGAKYISNNFTSTQNTGYLQKFNVNPASSNRFGHEYMANVQAAASEASNTYKAYSSANLLSATKTFYIPIYTGLDSNIDGFAVTGRGEGGKALWLDWNDVEGATQYEIYDVTNGANTLKGTVTASEFKFTDLTPAWEYDIKVVAIAADGNTSNATYRICAACAPVQNLAVSVKGTNEIEATWNYAVCHGYYIQWSTDPEFKSDVHGEWINNTFTESYAIATDGPANNYYVRIRCWKNYDGGKIFSDFTSGVKAGGMLPPTEFAVTGRGDGGKALWLDWSDVDGAVKYEVYDVTNNTSTLKDTVTKSEVKFIDLNPAWEYDIKVVAIDANGGTSSATYRICAACAPVENLVAVATGDNEITAGWDYAVCHGYYIQWSTDPEFKSDVHGEWINNTFTESYAIATDSPANNYYVRIRCWKNYNGGKIFSDFTDAERAMEIIPTESFAVTGRGSGGKSLWLDWADAKDAVIYGIVDVTNDEYTEVGTSEESNFTFTNLNPSWEYDVVVVGFDKNGDACAISDSYRFCAACPPVENFKATITGNNTISATWDYAVCHGYYIQWSTDPEFKSDLHGEWINDTFTENYAINTDGSAENYYVRIRCWKYYNDGKIFSDFSAPILPE